MSEAASTQSPPRSLADMSGYEQMCAVRDGRAPAAPIAALMGMSIIHIGEGTVTFQGIPGPEHYNPIGTVHGGWFGTMLDSCMGCAVHTSLAPGFVYTTLEYKVSLLRPVFDSTGPLHAIGKVIHSGRRTATADGQIVGPDGKIYATGTTTCIVMPRPAGN